MSATRERVQEQSGKKVGQFSDNCLFPLSVTDGERGYKLTAWDGKR